jgi:3-deoxy-D-manno-octulosonic-acid transferase
MKNDDPARDGAVGSGEHGSDHTGHATGSSFSTPDSSFFILHPSFFILHSSFVLIAQRLYTAALHGARAVLPLLASGEGKLARGVRGRRGAVERMEAWGSGGRDGGRPLIWFHAPSVGEGLQARIVAELLREKRPDVQVAYTFFSPSAERFARTVPADFADYLPLDLPALVRRALDALRPSVIAFTKTEVWPNLATEAKRRGVGLALLSATLPPGSSRLSPLARPFLLPGFARLDRLAAISPDDESRFGRLGVPPERRTVMGDARFDQVWQRARSVPADDPLLRLLGDRSVPTLVAGSTWPADEEVLVPALAAVRDAGAAVRLILVPHEPTEPHLAGAESMLGTHGFPAVRLADLESGRSAPGEVILVDRVGVLGVLYALADVAYVGGGFGGAGLHSVLEPAAFGAPVLFGPRHENAREAAELVRAGGAFSEPDAERMAARLPHLLEHEAARRTAGDAARDYVRSGLGAAARAVDLLESLLP